MKKLMRLLGILAFWVSWPISFVYLQRAERARVLLVAGDKVLLIRNWHSSGGWSLPGGGIHKGEDPKRAATRELKEETDVALGVDQLKPLGTKAHHEYGLKFTCRYFVGSLSEIIQANPRLPEVLDAEWVDVRTIDGYRLASDARYALSAYGALLQ